MATAAINTFDLHKKALTACEVSQRTSPCCLLYHFCQEIVFDGLQGIFWIVYALLCCLSSGYQGGWEIPEEKSLLLPCVCRSPHPLPPLIPTHELCPVSSSLLWHSSMHPGCFLTWRLIAPLCPSLPLFASSHSCRACLSSLQCSDHDSTLSPWPQN